MEFQSVSETLLCFKSAVSKTKQGLLCDTHTLQTQSLKSIHYDWFRFTANWAICQSHAFDWCLHLISISLPKSPCDDVRAEEVQTGRELHARWWVECLGFIKCFFLWNGAHVGLWLDDCIIVNRSAVHIVSLCTKLSVLNDITLYCSTLNTGFVRIVDRFSNEKQSLFVLLHLCWSHMKVRMLEESDMFNVTCLAAQPYFHQSCNSLP